MLRFSFLAPSDGLKNLNPLNPFAGLRILPFQVCWVPWSGVGALEVEQECWDPGGRVQHGQC
jgi:hypothetical protein